MNITEELTQTKAKLITAIAAFDEQNFNRVLFDGSWTAGHIAEHLLKANNVALLYAETEVANRPADEKAQAVSDIFLNFDLKLIPPERIIPSGLPQNKNDLLNKLSEVFDKLIIASVSLDLGMLCMDWVISAFGPLTRLEFLWLFNAHTTRHIRQLNNIAVALAVK